MMALKEVWVRTGMRVRVSWVEAWGLVPTLSILNSAKTTRVVKCSGEILHYIRTEEGAPLVERQVMKTI